jgi:hypothetical protein
VGHNGITLYPAHSIYHLFPEERLALLLKQISFCLIEMLFNSQQSAGVLFAAGGVDERRNDATKGVMEGVWICGAREMRQSGRGMSKGNWMV